MSIKEGLRILVPFFLLIANYEALLINDAQVSLPVESLKFFKLKKTVVIDAGSTGSRAYVVTYEAGSVDNQLRGSLTWHLPSSASKKNPGLAAYVTEELKKKGVNQINCSKAEEQNQIYRVLRQYFFPMMRKLKLIISRKEREQTPMFILATGGFRDLGKFESDCLLNILYYFLKDETSYLVKKEWLSVIDGESEALYSWFALEELARAFQMRHSASLEWADMGECPIMDSRFALIEMGGSSVQIVVSRPYSANDLSEINYLEIDKNPECVFRNIIRPEGVIKRVFSCCGTSSEIISKSFSSLGRREAFKNFISQYFSKYGDHNIPCLPAYISFPQVKVVNGLLHLNRRDVKKKNFKFRKALDHLSEVEGNSYELCKNAIKETILENLPRFAGVAPQKIVALGSAYRYAQFIPDIEKGKFNEVPLSSMIDLAKRVCEARTENQIGELLPMGESDGEILDSSCFVLTWIPELLKAFFGVGEQIKIVPLKTINGIEVSWPLGYLLTEYPQIYRNEIAPTVVETAN